ncbi:MAG: calcineurin-like phosphoesterase C-terminal domain-containing protein [bacterium]
MRTTLLFFILLYSGHILGYSAEIRPAGQEQVRVSGIVFHDKTNNGSYDQGEDIPLEGIAVSNGRDIAITGDDGTYSLMLKDNQSVFVIKPRNWMVPVDENQLPQFYYVHSTQGAGGNDFEGLAAGGSLPESVDFPLYPVEEPDSFEVLVFGDTQPRDITEVYYIAHDVLPELTGADVAFGVTLGDIVFDDLDLFDPLKQSIATIGTPWRYVLGNHDIDFSAGNNTDARGAWYRTFGPSYYSFSNGPAHFIVLDNVRWIIEGDQRYYRTGLGEDQMEFFKNEVARLDDDQLLVILTHIPYTGSTAWQDEDEQKLFYEVLAGHSNSVSLVAHTHRHYHHFIGKEEGFPGSEPHHMISVGTTCGAWWTGAPDEYGIPHAMMSDGTPNSYTFLHIDGNEWKMKLKAAGRPSDYQMHIFASDSIQSNSTQPFTVLANIYNALPSADVKMRIGKDGEWISMERTPRHDPYRLAAAAREKQLGDEIPWRNLGGAQVSEHIWVAEPESNLSPGVYVIEIKAVDDWWEYEGRRLLHVK